MKRLGWQMVAFICMLLVWFPRTVQAADVYTVQVEVPGNGSYTLEMQRTDYIGTVKFKLQDCVDIDLNKMDLLYGGKILSEVRRFSSGDVPDGATLTMQPSTRWNYDEVHDVDDHVFSIARPKEESLKKIYAKDYGMRPDNADNTAAFTAAIKNCATNAYLIIEPGTYYFRNMTEDIAFNNMENVIIDGNNSTFIFDTKYCMKVYGGNGVEIRNLKVDWDWDKIPIGSLVQIDKKHSRNMFDIRFIGVDEVDENIPIGTFMYLDPKDLTIGSYGTYKAYTPGSVPGCLQGVEKVDHNVLRITHNGDMRHFNEGEFYLLRHFEYSGRAFGTARYAKNITYDNVSIYGFSGMGWVFGDKANHFQLINSYLGLNPEKTKERRISTAADAIHILNTGGYFRISNCDLGFTGDDIINIHDDVMDILSISEDRRTLRGWATAGIAEAGDVLRFRNSQLGACIDYEAKVVAWSNESSQPNVRVVTLAEPLPKEITEECIVCNASRSTSHYVISNNYIHEARARAALLNDDYGLFENNHVYRMYTGAIQMCAEVAPERYLEGEGSQHVVARNNIFEECNFGIESAVVTVGVKIAKQPGTEVVLQDIRVQDNLFLNCVFNETGDHRAIEANNVDGLIITGNVMENSGGIIIKDTVGATTVRDNTIIAAHEYVNGICIGCKQMRFTDVKLGGWQETVVRYMLENGIMSGRNETTFDPDTAMTRAQLVKVLWNLEGQPQLTGKNPFSDVSTKSVYYKAILWASKKKIVNGYATGEFKPSEPLTRQQIAAILMNYSKYKGIPLANQVDFSSYKDATSVSKSMTTAMQWAVGNKIISGKSGGTLLDPKGQATRVEVAAMVMNYCKKFR